MDHSQCPEKYDGAHPHLTLEAGGSTYPDTPHEGEEFGYVLQGSVSIHLGNKTYRAKEGRILLLYPGQEALSVTSQSRRIADLGQHTAQLLNHPACSLHTARLQHTKS